MKQWKSEGTMAGTVESLEGQLAAHRRLLGKMLACMTEDGQFASLLEFVHGQQSGSGGSEASSAASVATSDFDVALANELKVLAEVVDAHAAEKDVAPVREAGPEAMRDPPRRWDSVDEASDESFPSSDPPSTY